MPAGPPQIDAWDAVGLMGDKTVVAWGSFGWDGPEMGITPTNSPPVLGIASTISYESNKRFDFIQDDLYFSTYEYNQSYTRTT